MEGEDWVLVCNLECFLCSSYRRCQLEEDDNKLKYIDVYLANFEKLACSVRPHNIKPIFQLVAESATTDWASVAEAGELGVAGYDMPDVNRPWAVGIRD